MAKERILFIISFAFLGLVAALLFRHTDPPPIHPVTADTHTPGPEKPEVKETPKAPPSVSLPLEPGKIAVPFQLTNRSAIVQFMNPGHMVDVIFTSKSDIDFGTVSLILLKNIRLLQIGKNAENLIGSPQTNFKSNSPIEILLEMTLRESEVFSYAEQAGTISLVFTDSTPLQENNPLAEKLLKSESGDNFNSILVTNMIGSLFPQAKIKIIATSKGYILDGEIPDAAMADKIIKILGMLSKDGSNSVINLAKEEGEFTPILVAQTDLKAGDHLSPKDYAWAKIPAHQLNPSFIVRNSQSEKWMSESILAKNISKGQEIHVCDIIWPKEYLDIKNLDVDLPSLDGILAVPFQLPARALIIQLMHPGMPINLKFTSKVETGIGNETFTLFKNIPILSIRDTQGKAFHNKSSFYHADPTIEVFIGMTRRQAEIFSYSLQSGFLTLEIPDKDDPEQNQKLVGLLMQSKSAGQFQSILISEMISFLFPHVDVKVTASPKGYIIEGNVPDPQTAKKIIEVLAKMVPNGEQGLINMMSIDPQQVLICVKVYEITKGLKENLGVNWSALLRNGGATALFQAFYPSPPATDPNYLFSATGIQWGKVTLSTLINMLEEDAYGKVLAEPNLTTVSGETAHFFAGGEFPILIPQGGNLIGTVTIEYKKYGVLLDFTPVVELNGLITMHIVPEVSNLDKANAVVLNGFVIPALVSRRVDTIVKLWPGQSYLIAGMFLDELTETDDNLFGLNRIPLIGPLFNSKHSEDAQTELIIVVTPYLVDNEEVCDCSNQGYGE